MNTLGPASELSAVNELLAAIGEDPIENMELMPPSGHTALTALRNQSRDFQEEGYWFNRESAYPLTPEEDGRILIPDNILSLDGTDQDVIERRPYLYNRETKGFEFSGPVNCEVILHLPWEQLPPAARRYIVALATERFVDGFPGAQGVSEARHRNLLRAKVAFDKAVIRNEGFNLLNNITISQLTRR